MANIYFLGLDVSTTGAKALIINALGEVVHSSTNPLPLSTPKPLWSEQDPADWWTGMVKSIREVIVQSGTAPSDIKAVGLTGQMHGLTLLDDAGEVLRPAILWNDQRTGQQCE
ncbi:MAG: FGGY family carbohydrate kinase, partial [Anaerolineae bacterium]|nr:FGGY family carbohydrate kinase [Anaerolineae bacterium]